MDLPIPGPLPCPLPPFLTRAQCVLLLRHWNLGGKSYLAKLIAAGSLRFHKRPGVQRGSVTTSEAMLRIYQRIVKLSDG